MWTQTKHIYYILNVTSRIFWKSKDCTVDHSEIHIMVSLFFLNLNFSFWNWAGFLFEGTTLECCTLILTFTMATEYRKRSTSLTESWQCPSTNMETTSSPAQVTVVEIILPLSYLSVEFKRIRALNIFLLICWELG